MDLKLVDPLALHFMDEITEDDIEELRKFGPVEQHHFSAEVVSELCRRAELPGRFVVCGVGSVFIIDIYEPGEDYPGDKIGFVFCEETKLKVSKRRPTENDIFWQEEKMFDLNDPASFEDIASYIWELMYD
jgi:hypothetical protein